MNKGSLAIKEIFDLAVQNHEKNNFTEAQKLYEKILKINSNHLESIFFLGTLSAQIKNFSRAIQLFNKVIEINPNIADVHSNLGLVFKELGEFKKSINCYEQAIKINPNNRVGIHEIKSCLNNRLLDRDLCLITELTISIKSLRK